jgi:cyclic beta-1,2-glucan synthetase
MQQAHCTPENNKSLPAQALLYAAGACATAAAAVAVQQGGTAAAVLAASLLGVLAAGIIKYGFTRCRLTLPEALQDALITGALAAAAAPDLRIWQSPGAWHELFTITSPAAAAACIIYFSITAYCASAKGRHVTPVAGSFILAVPLLFNCLLLLQSPVMLESIGRFFAFGAVRTPEALQWMGKAAVLIIINEAVANGLILLLAGRLLNDARMHALLLASALFSSATPAIAGLGSGAAVAALPSAIGTLAAIAAATISQAGLWGQTFLLTGLIMDSLHSKHPAWYWGPGHYKSGFTQGTVYSAVFMSLIHAAAAALSVPGVWSLLTAYPVICAGTAGLIIFPFIKTIVESFDGSLPFVMRLRSNYSRWDHCLRGGVVGIAVAFALREGLPAAVPAARFLYGITAGAASYAAVNLLRDVLNVTLLGRRLRVQAPRIYLTEALMGGLAGGALCWYFDTMQAAVVAAKCKNYATLWYASAGIKVEDYVIYPLFSKWGAMNLGAVTGGVRLFFNESLSGVINWSIAAPLFSINLVALTALVQRSTAPLKNLFTRQGIVAMVEQAFRVQRWGLWMAPIIYSFLRMSPDPSWYNQDGALRTAVATAKSLTSSPAAFRAWSLQTFTNLLAYDWLRIAIFIDHMGLRVATLVNLSFVGMDVVDEKTARFLGHAMRTRVIPSGLRRFATWAPLLIPFYIPRGSDWDTAWNSAEAIAKAHPLALFPPALLPGAFLTISLFVGGAVLARQLHKHRHSASAHPQQAAAAEQEAACANLDGTAFVIHNGFYTLTLAADGRGWSRVFSSVRAGNEIDLTRRLHDPLQLRGKFFYLKDLDMPAADPARIWSLTFQPMRRVGEDYCVTRLDRSTLRIVNTWNRIRAEAIVRIDCQDTVERWTLKLTNLENRPRAIELTSYQEFALNVSDAYLRHPDFNNIHIGTWFVPDLNAILACNRLLKDAHRDPVQRKVSREIAFHAAGENPGGNILLTGYEDSRLFFIGHGSLRRPEGLEERPRRLSDDGLLYTFDPAASLRLHCGLAPHGSTDIMFADGYADSPKHAQHLIKKYLKIPVSTEKMIAASFNRRRILHGFGAPSDEDKKTNKNCAGEKTLFSFSPDGTELSMNWDTPRPWTHVIANEREYGVVLNNEGEIYSFMGNSQQNGITPFSLNNVPVQVPGQALYLYNRETGALDGPTFLPFRKIDEPCDTTFGRGYAVYRKTTPDAHLEYTLFVPPGEPAEVRLLKIKNRSSRAMTYRVVPYLQIMLGEIPSDTRGKISAEYDEAAQALFFSNPQNDFYRGTAFVATSLKVLAYETVRSRFVGGNGRDLSNPFMAEHGMPCADMPDDGCRIAGFCGTLTVPAGAEETMVMVVGQAGDADQARTIIRGLLDKSAALAALQKTERWWAETLSVMRIETSDPGFDRMVNDWLPYQVLAAHLWGRTGPNQRSGGYGYRDQLQDMLPFLYLNPEMARTQILLHARQQFFTGDVMQWWHQSWEARTGLGVRNRASDPHLWLAYMVYQYVEATGDLTILDEELTYLEGRRIPRDREGVMFAPRLSRDREPLYWHCVRAIDLTLQRLGANGLPLIGTGDWNDGLSLIGFQGRGESTWLGFFLYDILTHFANIAGLREGDGKKNFYLDRAAGLRKALDGLWRDGQRYARAITDSGEEMVFNDALNASWPVISGAADCERGACAVEQGLKELEQENLVLLLSPAFTENSHPNPGKLADYPPGVRENGGQYSHGASWLVDALVKLSELVRSAGDESRAGQYLARAVNVWRKISPLDDITPERIDRYGLPPHQQPADVYHGYGYDGRGGWSWYTGAAARMLFTAYKILGLTMQNGSLIIPENLFQPKGTLTVKRLIYKGGEYRAARPGGKIMHDAAGDASFLNNKN